MQLIITIMRFKAQSKFRINRNSHSIWNCNRNSPRMRIS